MALNTITQFVLPDGTEIAITDWSDRPLYSSCDLGSGYSDQEMDLFQYTAGDSVPGAAPAPTTLRTSTLADTDLASAGELPTTEEALVYAIKPEVMEFLWDGADFNSRRYLGAASAAGTTTQGFPAATLQCLAVLSQQLLLRLRVTEKDYTLAGFGYFNPGFGIHGTASPIPGTAANPSRTIANLGLPSQEAVRALALPVHIGGQEKFRLTLVNDTGTAVNFGKTENNGTQLVDPNVMITVRCYLDGLLKRPTA